MITKVAEILEFTKKPMLKTRIMAKCGLDSKHFSEWIDDLLLPSGLLDAYPAIDVRGRGRRSKRRMVYITSLGGIEFLRRYHDLLNLVKTGPYTSQLTIYVKGGV